jgi:hypothetical protein
MLAVWRLCALLLFIPHSFRFEAPAPVQACLDLPVLFVFVSFLDINNIYRSRDFPCSILFLYTYKSCWLSHTVEPETLVSVTNLHSCYPK